MDPQKLSQLDPKLREAYQHVMGTAIPEPQVAPASPTLQQGEPVQAQTPTIEEPPAAPQPPVQPPVSEPQPTISPEPLVQAGNFGQMNSEVQAAPSQNFISPSAMPQAITLKKKNGIMLPILFGIVGLVFIAVYTLFWTKIFNFKLPFLP